MVAPPLFHEQACAVHVPSEVKEVQLVMVPVQVELDHEQPDSSSHAVDDVLALQGVSVPVHEVVDQLQKTFASQVDEDAKVEHGDAVPVHEPLQVHPAARQ